ncbi:MAG: extracellular solute-binding protein family 1 [Herbinix sp.]|jgi:raffinose/stachyose/melibiose transport system substrate-binding protein|nr:extracellular solute-binding protein family 1 [Herbinix sp.]
MMKKVLVVILTLALTISLVACSSKGTKEPTSENGTTKEQTDVEKSEDVADPVTIKVFSNLPDRTSGQGFVEQTLFDAYMDENTNVTIEVETLDDEAYKTKFKAYAAGSKMPDLVSVWGQPGFIDEVIDAGILEPLHEEDYKEYGFINGSLDGFSKDGVIFGLPRNTDVLAFYYNQKMFQDHGWTVPQTYDELLTLADKINAEDIIPVAMDGGDKWPLYIFITDLMMKIDGSGILDKVKTAITNKDFSDPTFMQAADLLYESAQRDLFEIGFETTDYGTAQNLFTNAQSAMYYMGSWDMSMATNQDIPAEIRDNIRVFTMPVIQGGKATATDITAWNGGGYSITSSGAQKEEARKLLNYMFKPEGWTKLAWENGVCMSAQDFAQFETGNETEIQKQFMQIVKTSTNISGSPLGDLGTTEFKTVTEDSVQDLSIGKITSEEFLTGLENVYK